MGKIFFCINGDLSKWQVSSVTTMSSSTFFV